MTCEAMSERDAVSTSLTNKKIALLALLSHGSLKWWPTINHWVYNRRVKGSFIY